MTKFFQNWLWVSALAFLFSFIVPLPAWAATSEPVMVVDINPGDGLDYSFSRNFAVFNNALYFGANDGTHGYELWKSDGTAEGTVMVVDINPEGDASYYGWFGNFAVFNNALYFSAYDDTHGSELWKTDGTEEGTVMVADINPNGNSLPYELTVLDNTLYFGADDGTHGWELWKSDGTEEGTVMVVDIDPGAGGGLDDYFYDFTVFNGVLYFGAYDDTHGRELWKSDGTAEGTVMVADINPDGDSETQYLTVFQNELYFQADDGTNGAELWKTDGTEEGTMMVKDIRPGSGNSYPENLAVFNGVLYFSANDGIHGHELWKSDGTEEGTVMVVDINPVEGSKPQYLTVFNNELYFSLAEGDNTYGAELWKSDGTAEGTEMVADINPDGNSWPKGLTVFNGELYFSAYDDTHYRELWKISILEEEGEGSSDSSSSSDSSKSISATLKKSSKASDPNVVPGWKHPVMAGPNFTGTHGFIPNINVTSDISRLASVYLDALTHHDDLYIEHSMLNFFDVILDLIVNPDSVKLPWTQGFNAVSEISKIEAKASFNGYPVTETDNPFIILLGYDPNKLGNIPKEQLKIAWFNETTKKWETIKGAYVYPDGKIATVTNKFGYFSVVYPRSWWGSR